MGDYSERIKDLEQELSNTKYNKRTQHAVGLLKAKIASLKDKQEAGKGGRKGEGFAIKKSGDATVVLLGFPSVGKSTLLNQLTNAESKVAAYDFTTLTVIPGLLEYNDAKIQLLDLPGIIRGASEGKGRGKEIFAALRFADLIIIMVDVHRPGQLKVVEDEVYEIGLRLNKRQPDVRIKRTSKGGINLILTRALTKIDEATVKGILNEFRILNADVVIRDDIDADDLIDVLAGNRVYVPSLVVLNKIDTVSEQKLEQVKKAVKADAWICADKGVNMEMIKVLIWEKLGLIRVYCKQPGKRADVQDALILKQEATLKNVCDKLHRSFARKFRFARIWGSAKFPGLRINSLGYAVKDKDVVELHVR
ncbi:MAG: GTPase [Candidatus Woesearchaeota archaeon]